MEPRHIVFDDVAIDLRGVIVFPLKRLNTDTGNQQGVVGFEERMHAPDKLQLAMTSDGDVVHGSLAGGIIGLADVGRKVFGPAVSLFKILGNKHVLSQ